MKVKLTIYTIILIGIFAIFMLDRESQKPKPIIGRFNIVLIEGHEYVTSSLGGLTHKANCTNNLCLHK